MTASRHFLKGPIPWEGWMVRAIPLPGRALPVALAIWLWAGMTKKRTVRLSMMYVFPSLSISRYSVYRALCSLEHAGLIRVRRRRGHAPIVTIVMVTEQQPQPKHARTRRSHHSARASFAVKE